MNYVGNKSKIAHLLLPILLESRGNRTWVEPFVGGANMLIRVGGKRIANDKHTALIALHKAVQNGWKPPTTVTRTEYYEIKANQHKYPPELVAFVGFGCSFRSKWFDSYAHNDDGTNYAEKAANALLNDAAYYDGVEFTNHDYRDLPLPDNALIYCDPPYYGTIGYATDINHTEFWQWCRDRSNDGHIVLVSEYTAPDDFTCVKIHRA